MSADLNPASTEAQQARQIQALQAEVLRLQTQLKLKDEEIRLLNLRRWGPKADQLSEAQLSLLPQEMCVSAPEVETEAARPDPEKALPRAKAPRSAHPGRAVLPEHLERREEIIPCRPEEWHCSQCGQERPVIGYEVREELGCQPAKFFVRVIKREKRGSHCQEEQGVAVAPAPVQIVPKSKLSNEFIIEALAAKFQQHQPVYRQCAVWLEDHGIELSRQNGAFHGVIQFPYVAGPRVIHQQGNSRIVEAFDPFPIPLGVLT